MLWFCQPNVLVFCWLLDSKFMMHNNHVCFSCYGNGWILQAGSLQLVKPYMVAVQSNNVAAVNEALNEIYVEEEDYERLRESIDMHDNFDQMGLAQKVFVLFFLFFFSFLFHFYIRSSMGTSSLVMNKQVEKHELLEMRRIAAYIYKKAGRWRQSVALSKKENLYRDAMETCSQSGDRELSEQLLVYFVEQVFQ